MILWFYCDEYSAGNDTSTSHEVPSVRTMMKAGYTGPDDGNEVSEADHLSDDHVLLHLHMMVLADKYQIPRLMEDATLKVVITMKANKPSFWSLMQYIDSCSDHLQETLCRLLVLQATRNSWLYLTDDRFGDVIKEKPELAWRIVKGSQ